MGLHLEKGLKRVFYWFDIGRSEKEQGPKEKLNLTKIMA